jgi:DNA invertase Pin-like site-specific DNA recombinase
MNEENEKPKTRVAVYIRISTDEQKKNSTYLNQEDIIRQFVENRSDTLEFA